MRVCLLLLSFASASVSTAFTRRCAAAPSLPQVPVVTAVEGCAASENPKRAVRCPTNGLQPITVHGRHFEAVGLVEVTVGGRACGHTRRIDDTRVRCALYPGTGAGHVVRVRVAGEESQETDVAVDYSPVPVVTRVSGCNDTLNGTKVWGWFGKGENGRRSPPPPPPPPASSCQCFAIVKRAPHVRCDGGKAFGWMAGTWIWMAALSGDRDADTLRPASQPADPCRPSSMIW